MSCLSGIAASIDANSSWSRYYSNISTRSLPCDIRVQVIHTHSIFGPSRSSVSRVVRLKLLCAPLFVNIPSVQNIHFNMVSLPCCARILECPLSFPSLEPHGLDCRCVLRQEFVRSFFFAFTTPPVKLGCKSLFLLKQVSPQHSNSPGYGPDTTTLKANRVSFSRGRTRPRSSEYLRSTGLERNGEIVFDTAGWAHLQLPLLPQPSRELRPVSFQGFSLSTRESLFVQHRRMKILDFKESSHAMFVTSSIMHTTYPFNRFSYFCCISVNVSVGPHEDRRMTTGLHTVADIYCNCCQQIVGWKYELAHEPMQKYKEGKFILERAKVVDGDSNGNAEYYLDSQPVHSDTEDV